MLGVVLHLLEEFRQTVRVRIKKRPTEREIDGVSLKDMLPGAVRDVSAELGTWLIVEEYADSEMRQSGSSDDPFNGYFTPPSPFPRQRDRRVQKR